MKNICLFPIPLKRRKIEMFDTNGMEAEKNLAYIAGLRDMANAVIEAIQELEG